MTSRIAVPLGLILAFALLAPRADADDPPVKGKPGKGIAGIWQGDIKAGKTKVRFVVQISRKGEDAYRGTLSCLEHNIKDLPLEKITLKVGAVHFEQKQFKAVFEGKLNKDGSEIAGRWKQGGVSVALTFKRVAKAPTLRRPQEPNKPYPYDEQEVTYENKKAGVKLAATLTLPRGKGPVPAVLLIAGSGAQDRDGNAMGHKPYLLLADYLTRRGIAVLRADKRGIGKSTGDPPAKATPADLAEDAEAGLAFLRRQPKINPKQIGLIGHSEGGFIAPLVAARSKDVAFIVLMAGAGLPGDEVLLAQNALLEKAAGVTGRSVAWRTELRKRLYAAIKQEKDNTAARKKYKAILAEELAKLSEEDRKAEGPYTKGMERAVELFVSPYMRYFLTTDPRPNLRKVRCPVLAVIGEKDLQVPPKENLTAIKKALEAGGNKDYTVKELPWLNHLFQTCKTGSMDEYAKIEETLAPAFLELVGGWIRKQTAPAKASSGG
jgi:pimeloyl-ACP methyl ester carboxylesterase